MTLRKPFYERSDFQVETDGRSPEQVADFVLDMLKGKL